MCNKTSLQLLTMGDKSQPSESGIFWMGRKFPRNGCTSWRDETWQYLGWNKRRTVHNKRMAIANVLWKIDTGFGKRLWQSQSEVNWKSPILLFVNDEVLRIPVLQVPDFSHMCWSYTVKAILNIHSLRCYGHRCWGSAKRDFRKMLRFRHWIWGPEFPWNENAS
jgi:hypothetical protein